LIPARICILFTASDSSTITCFGEVPAGFEAKDLCSLIACFTGCFVTTFLETVSKTNFTSLTVSA
jgi:hypothetical protein